MSIIHKKEKILSSLFWKLLERSGTQGVQFIIQLYLARILFPKDYGLIALVTIVISISNVLIQSGFNTALIQKKDATDEDFSSVFFSSILLALIIYILIFLLSPSISRFYNEPKLISLLRVLSVNLFFGALNSIQNAFVARNLLFKRLFYSSLFGVILSGSSGICLAYLGYGVWALVAQQIVNQITISLVLWFTVKWRPKLFFSFVKIKPLISFGWKILVSSLIDTLHTDLRKLVVGKVFDAATLGIYYRGQQFPAIIVSNINGSIQSVLLPVLSNKQDDLASVKHIVRRAITVSSFVILPSMFCLAVIAEPLVKLVLTEKWLSCVPFLQIYCFSFAFWPIHTANIQAINALGRSDVFLKLEIIKKIVGVLILFGSIFGGLYMIALGSLLTSIVCTFINAYPNRKILNYSILEQFKDIFPSFILSLSVGSIIFLFKYFINNILTLLILQISCGAILYFLLSNILKSDPFTYLKIILKQYSKRV